MKNTKRSVKPASVSIASSGVPLCPMSTPPESDSKCLESHVVGDAVTRYNRHAQEEKDAKANKEKVREELQDIALETLFDYNTQNPDGYKSTIKLTDEEDSSLNVSFKNVYLPITNEKKVLSALVGVKDPNDFIQRKVVVGFDTSVFYNEDGSLNKELYMDMMRAIEDTAARHGVKSPFSSSEVTTVRPTFHADRWKIYADPALPVDIQYAIFNACPNSVSFTPCKK